MQSVDNESGKVNSYKSKVCTSMTFYQIANKRITTHLYENYMAVNRKTRNLQRRRGFLTTDGDKS